jgi:glycosyltransferase involved in cell wall biosynthesis
MSKKKILVIADSPLAPSGVGTQTKYMIEAMLRTGEFSFVCLAGAIKHADYRPVKVSPYDEDWIIHPVDGYGNPEIIRQMIHSYKPDALWFMTDPRFYVWLWNIADEIRPKIPMIYYHVWDNYPYPNFNKAYYDSNDVICTISKLTDDIVRNVSPEVKCVHIPHTVDTNIFKKVDSPKIDQLRKKADADGKMVFFWNNRNARRKQSGTLIFWFKEFLDKVGHENAMLIMHTEPKDPNGQDLEAIIEELGLTDGQVLLSTVKVESPELANLYNLADCTINIADAEGFGLGTLESLACETPIIVTMTGGMQEQVTNGEDWFGFGIGPASKAIIGSQDVPYIYEDRVSKEDFLTAMTSFYELSQEERDDMGSAGRKHVLDNYSMAKYSGLWYQTFQEVFEDMGSWETRKNYKSWELFEV